MLSFFVLATRILEQLALYGLEFRIYWQLFAHFAPALAALGIWTFLSHGKHIWPFMIYAGNTT